MSSIRLARFFLFSISFALLFPHINLREMCANGYFDIILFINYLFSLIGDPDQLFSIVVKNGAENILLHKALSVPSFDCY